MPSNACAKKMAAPTKPITAVTVSIISNVLFAPRAEKDVDPAQSKKFRLADAQSPSTEDFAQQVCQSWADGSRSVG